MKYNEIIKEKIPLILDEVRKNIKMNRSVYDFVDNEKELDRLLDIQEELVKKYLLNFEKKDFNEKFCYQFYKDLNIPYAIVFASLNFIKKSIMKELSFLINNKNEIFEFSEYFELFINLAAKVYLKKEISSLKKIKNSSFKDFLLYKSVLDYANKIIDTVSEDNSKNFPLVAPKECTFSEYLYYPESLMICIDKNLCGYLDELHTLIHRSANSFYIFYTKKNFSEAYFIFKDLKEQILKLLSTISELYFVTFSDVEKSFFKLSELIEHDETVYLTMIDFKNLKNYNNIYGELKISDILNKLEKKLKRFFSSDMARTLFIKGITSNFYIMNIRCKTDDEYEKMIFSISDIINSVLKKEKIDLEFIVCGLKIERFSQYKDSEIIKMLHILKDEAKKQKKDLLLAIVEGEIETLKKIFYEKYTKKFIKEKIKNNEIEIVFQPILNLCDSKIYSLEVLGRINDFGKYISAGVFIDKIYEMGMIDKFDIAILNKIIENLDSIEKVTNRIFVNVSFKALLNEEYLKKIDELVEKNKSIEIVFELTEQKFIENIEIVEELHKKHNLYFAIDDFGSGYSSLKSVVDLVKKGVLKVLKIDGTLIDTMADDIYLQKIVKIISQMSSELEILSVAEYVETDAILKYLEKFGIDLAQGYFISKPKLISELLVEKMGKLDF